MHRLVCQSSRQPHGSRAFAAGMISELGNCDINPPLAVPRTWRRVWPRILATVARCSGSSSFSSSWSVSSSDEKGLTGPEDPAAIPIAPRAVSASDDASPCAWETDDEDDDEDEDE